MGKIRRYTEEEDQFIRDNYLKMTDEEIGEELGRTKGSITKHRIYDLKLNKREYITYNTIKNYFKNSSYIFINETYKYNLKVTIQDKDGYYYYTNFNNLKTKGIIPNKFDASNPYTIYNIRLWLKLNKNNLCLIDNEYSGANKLTLKDTWGYYYYIYSIDLIQGKDPSRFFNNNPYTVYNIKLWLKLNNKSFELISDVYEDAITNLQWKCLKEDCGEIFKMSWSHVNTGSGCSFCAGRQVGLSNCLATKNPQLAKEWHHNLNGSLTPYNVTANSSKKVWWKCKKCACEWKAQISNRNHGTNCPKCAESKGEKRIKEYLEQKEILYDSQYTFKELLSDLGNSLRFDFVIFNKNNKIKFLIEYDGEQHFKWIKGWMTKEEFKTLQYHDRLKNEYCKNNNIKLLRIKYDVFDNIEEILNDYFQNTKIKIS